MRTTTWITGVALATLAIVAAGCARGTPTPPVAAPPAGQEAASRVEVTMRDFAFVRRTIRVKAGTVEFVLRNEGGVEHDFAIPSLEAHDAHDQHLVGPGRTLTVSLDLRPGTYEAVCTVPGHKEAGMVAVVEVVP